MFLTKLKQITRFLSWFKSDKPTLSAVEAFVYAGIPTLPLTLQNDHPDDPEVRVFWYRGDVVATIDGFPGVSGISTDPYNALAELCRALAAAIPDEGGEVNTPTQVPTND